MFLVRTTIIFILLFIIVGLIGFGIRLVKFNPIEKVPNEEIVRPAPDWIQERKVPIWAIDSPFAIYPYIYLSEEDYLEFTEGELSVEFESILVKERSNLIRQEKSHPLVVGVKCLFSKKYRLQEELRAIEDQMIFLKDKGQREYSAEQAVTELLGKKYGSMSQEEATNILTELWEKAGNEEDTTK